jgi:hypothetical protein
MSAARLPLAALLLVTVACGHKGPPLPPELVRPEAAEGLAAAAADDGVRLTWKRPLRYSGGQRMHDLGHFVIERASGDGEGAPFLRVGTLALDDQTRFRRERHLEWVDRDARSGTTYRYRVTAVTLDGYRSLPAGPVALRYARPSAARKEPR